MREWALSLNFFCLFVGHFSYYLFVLSSDYVIVFIYSCGSLHFTVSLMSLSVLLSYLRGGSGGGFGGEGRWERKTGRDGREGKQ